MDEEAAAYAGGGKLGGYYGLIPTATQRIDCLFVFCLFVYRFTEPACHITAIKMSL